jgi:ribonuclease HI
MTIRIVTDGASTGNPGPGGWAALIIRDGAVEELGGHEPNTTNNRMEMRAVIEALRRVPADAPVQVFTDSRYVMDGATKWVRGWQRRGWTTASGDPVKNRDLWETLVELAGKRVQWQHVRGHAGHPENERANTIAQAHAAGKDPGPALPLATAGSGDTADADLLERIAALRPGKKTYLSLIGDQLMRHATWDECQGRVHGVPNARYKKANSAADELATVRAWGLDADVLF